MQRQSPFQATDAVQSVERVAIFRGSFDPPHHTHQAIVQYCLEQEHCDKVYVVTPDQTFYDRKPNRSDFAVRKAMLEIVFGEDQRVVISGDYQRDIIEKLKQDKSSVHLIKIIGADKLAVKEDPQDKSRVNPDELLVFPREGAESAIEIGKADDTSGASVRFAAADQFQKNGMSSTEVRTYLASHEGFFASESRDEIEILSGVEKNRRLNDYIRQNKLYQKTAPVEGVTPLRRNSVFASSGQMEKALQEENKDLVALMRRM